MSTAEITAYLAGVDIGQRADREHVPPGSLVAELDFTPPQSLFQSWRQLGSDRFRYWVNRGVWEAWKQ